MPHSKLKKLPDDDPHSQAASIRAQAVYQEEVKRIQAALDEAAAETLDEGCRNNFTAATAISHLHAKLRKFFGPWV